MTPQEEKVHLFLTQFRAEDEFLAWCEGNGVKGVRCLPNLCLLSEAVRAATGVEIQAGYRAYTVSDSVHQLPKAVYYVPEKFDLCWWPKLVR